MRAILTEGYLFCLHCVCSSCAPHSSQESLRQLGTWSTCRRLHSVSLQCDSFVLGRSWTPYHSEDICRQEYGNICIIIIFCGIIKFNPNFTWHCTYSNPVISHSKFFLYFKNIIYFLHLSIFLLLSVKNSCRNISNTNKFPTEMKTGISDTDTSFTDKWKLTVHFTAIKFNSDEKTLYDFLGKTKQNYFLFIPDKSSFCNPWCTQYKHLKNIKTKVPGGLSKLVNLLVPRLACVVQTVFLDVLLDVSRAAQAATLRTTVRRLVCM